MRTSEAKDLLNSSRYFYEFGQSFVKAINQGRRLPFARCMVFVCLPLTALCPTALRVVSRFPLAML